MAQYRINIEVVEVDHTGRTDRAKRVDGWVVFPPNSSIPGYPDTDDDTDHQWMAYDDDGRGNGDAVESSDSRALSHTLSIIAEIIGKRYF